MWRVNLNKSILTRHWPEFGQKGKGDIKVEDVLRHESGLPFFGETIKLDDFRTESIKRNSVGELIERQELVSKVTLNLRMKQIKRKGSYKIQKEKGEILRKCSAQIIQNYVNIIHFIFINLLRK